MSRKDPSTRINSRMFSAGIDAWAEKRYGGPSFKKSTANRDLAKILPDKVESETVRSWRYRNSAVGEANLQAINDILEIDCALKESLIKEESVMTREKKPLTIQGLLALELYRYIFGMVNSVTFDSTPDEIEGHYYELQREIESRECFLISPLKELIENALDEIVLPLLDEELYSDEYTAEIGHFTEEGVFSVENQLLLVQKHEEIMAPFREKLEILGENICSQYL